MNFYPDHENSKWADARDDVASRHSFLLKAVPALLANGMSVADAVNIARAAHDVIDADAAARMEAIKHLKEQK